MEEERRANMLVDWHDFVVVETIGFEDDDDGALPAPQELDAPTGAGKSTDAPASQPPASQPPAGLALGSAPPPPPPPPPPPGEAEPPTVAGPAMMKSGGLAPVPEHLIRKDYVSTVGTTASAASAAAIYAVDPLTGQQVRVDEMEEHMRISLLDPKWKEQKQVEEERRKDTNIASGNDVSRHLKSFAARRTDIFGDTEVGIGETVEKTAGGKGGSGEGGKVIWDGTTSSINRVATQATQVGLAQKSSAGASGAAIGAGPSAPPPSAGDGRCRRQGCRRRRACRHRRRPACRRRRRACRHRRRQACHHPRRRACHHPRRRACHHPRRRACHHPRRRACHHPRRRACHHPRRLLVCRRRPACRRRRRRRPPTGQRRKSRRPKASPRRRVSQTSIGNGLSAHRAGQPQDGSQALGGAQAGRSRLALLRRGNRPRIFDRKIRVQGARWWPREGPGTRARLEPNRSQRLHDLYPCAVESSYCNCSDDAHTLSQLVLTRGATMCENEHTHAWLPCAAREDNMVRGQAQLR